LAPLFDRAAPFGASLSGIIAGKGFGTFAPKGQNHFAAFMNYFILVSRDTKGGAAKKEDVNLYDVTRLKYP
jgi:hypothetical protein